MKNDLVKQKKEILLEEGWKECSSEFDFNYLINKDPLSVIKEFGYLISICSEHLNKNPLSFLGSEVNDAREEFIKSFCPPVTKPSAPTTTPFLSASWPLIKKDYENMECAFEELTYVVIRRIVEKLGTPLEIYQYNLDDKDNLLFKHSISEFSLSFLDNITIFKKLYVKWSHCYLFIEVSNKWHDNGAVIDYGWQLYSKDLRDLCCSVLNDIGLELNPTTYQLGELQPEYKLDSFPTYIQKFTEQLKEQMGFNLLNIKYPERFNLIVEGPPGFGKSRWTQSYAAEVLAPLGYLILCIDYSSLQSLVIPEYIDKVCIIVNDADTLALNRDISARGETEQVLAWLDGARTSFIKPFYFDKRTSVITIMTANSIEQWDEAALRQGRIHCIKQFDQVKLCDN
jgi:hypothetical protein